jgi:hypothetical protein
MTVRNPYSVVITSAEDTEAVFALRIRFTPSQMRIFEHASRAYFFKALLSNFAPSGISQPIFCLTFSRIVPTFSYPTYSAAMILICSIEDESDSDRVFSNFFPNEIASTGLSASSAIRFMKSPAAFAHAREDALEVTFKKESNQYLVLALRESIA